MKKRPTAFALLTLIAIRARRQNDTNFDDLELNEALIGDYETYGVTEQIYRTDKKFLEKYKFITYRATTKGTIVKIVDTTIFDINVEHTNERTNRQLTDSQRAANGQLTTNKELKKERNKEIYIYVSKFNELFSSNYKPTDGRAKKLKVRLQNFTLDQVLQALEALGKSKWHHGENDRNWKATPDFLIASDEKVDEWLNKQTQTPSKKLSDDPLAIAARQRGRRF